MLSSSGLGNGEVPPWCSLSAPLVLGASKRCCPTREKELLKAQNLCFLLFVSCPWSHRFTGMRERRIPLIAMNCYHLIHPTHSSCYASWKDCSTNTDSESHTVITTPKLFHLEPAPTVFNGLSLTCAQKKQSVSSISIHLYRHKSLTVRHCLLMSL